MIVTMQDYMITDRAPVLIGYEGENLSRTLTVQTTDDLSGFASIELAVGEVNCGAMTITAGDPSEISISLESGMIGKAGYKKAQLIMLDNTGNVVMKSNQFDVLVGASNSPRYFAAGENVKTLVLSIDGRSRQIVLPAGFIVSADGDLSVDKIAFRAPLTYGDFDFSDAACRVCWYGIDGTPHRDLCTATDSDGNWIWNIPSALTRGGSGEIPFSVSYVITDGNDAVTADWNTGLARFYHQESAYNENPAETSEDETTYDRLASAIADVRTAQATVEDINAILASLTSSTPEFVDTQAEMTDTTKLYVLTANAMLYYYNGSSWVAAFEFAGAQEVIDARTGANGTVYANLKARLDGENTAIKEDLTDIFNGKIGSIILSEYTDKSALKNGAIGGDGNVTMRGSYANNSRYFDYMVLDANATHIKVVVVETTPTNFYVYVNFYDANKNFLSRSGGGGRPYITIADIPANARYIRVSFTQITNSTLGDQNIVSVGVAQYIKKGIYSGKKLYIVGDSISVGYVSMFKSEAEEKGLYVYYTAPVENDGEAVGSVWDRSGTLTYWGRANDVWGMDMTNLSAPGKGYLRVSSTDSKSGVEVIRDTSFDDADVIIIALGFNDWHYNIARGTHDLIDANIPYPTEGYDTSQLTTYNQGIWYAIGEIARKAPNARLVVQTPMNGWAYGGDFSTNWGIGYSLENSGTLADIHDDIIYWCNYYGVQYLDMTYNNSVVNRVNIKQTIIDGSHPSEAAHRALGLYVSGSLL